MPTILVSTRSGCRVLSPTGKAKTELAGRQVSALTREAVGACLAVVDGQEVWRRAASGVWTKLADAGMSVQSMVSLGGAIYCGGNDDAVMVRIPANGQPEPLTGFDETPGRGEWFAGGPPLGVRSLTATVDGSTLLAAVHVGGIPRSEDGGLTWTPTIPVSYDVHEVQAHPSSPHIVAAATALGLCMSQDAGRTWIVHAESLGVTNSLAVAVVTDEVGTEDEALFAISDGPFAERSQVFRWPMGGGRLEQVCNGLPEWLEGKVDTGWIASGHGRAAILDGGGSLWLSEHGSHGWKRIANGLKYAFGVLIV